MSKDRLRVGEILQQGESITSANGRYRLTNHAQKPFEFVVLNPTQRLYGFKSQTENLKLCVQDDGNVVLYTQENKSIWSTQTDHKGNKNTLLVVQDDGDLVVECDGRRLWNTKTRVTDRLNVGETFDRGIMTSPNGKIRLLQESSDGSGYRFNLVLRDETGKKLWEEYTGGSYQFDLRKDDNLIGTDHQGHGTTFWSTKTKNPRPSGNAVFQVLDEGAVVLKARDKILWSTDSTRFPPIPLDPEDWSVSPEEKNEITWGESLAQGQSISSDNGEFSAVFREDGNWVVVYNPTKADLWSVQVTNPGAARMCMDYDNHFFSFDESGKKSERILDVNKREIMFGVVTYSNGCPVRLQDDGHLFSTQGGNPEWDKPESRFPWSNRLWFPICKDKTCFQLLPGQGLLVGQFLQTARGVDAAMVKYGLNEAGDIILIVNGKTTYFRTGPHASKVNYLRFTRKDFHLVGAAAKVLWTQPYSEPHGFNLAEKDPDPAKLRVEFYGDLVVKYKERLLWNVYDLPQSDSPSPTPQ